MAMMRLLHAIDQDSPQTTGPTLALVAAAMNELTDWEHHVLLIGSGRLRALAGASGLEQAGRLTMIGGRPWTAALAVRRWWKQQGGFDLVHCWSLGTFVLWGLLAPKTARLLTLTASVESSSLRLLSTCCGSGRLYSGGPVRLLAADAVVARQLLLQGLESALVQVVFPAVDVSALEEISRSAIRQRWGLVHPQARVVAVVSDPPWQADAMLAALAVGLAEEARGRQSLPLYLLVHPRQRHLQWARRTQATFGKVDRIIEEPELEVPWRAFPGCDLALTLGPAAGGLNLLWAMAAGLPIVASPEAGCSHLLIDGQSALLVPQNEPIGLARCIGQILDDPLRAQRMGTAARTCIAALASRQQYGYNLARLYSQLLEAANPARPSTASHGVEKNR